MARFVVALFLSLGVLVSADCYLKNPRGSNNRLDDRNRDRNNGNRVFDSQNNNRGGSNVGQVYYYTGSKVPMEWSVQHSCGNPNNHCEIIIQAMCDDRLRDGTTTNTIPIKPNECYNWDCDTDVRYGRHESFDSYMGCKYRQRNMGLFTSSQNLRGNSAIHTRQNPNGARRGLECPEERDYYPYWHPTEWKDIAILTNDEKRCAAYQAESQNVKPRYYCHVPIHGFMRWYDNKNNRNKRKLLPLNQVDCEGISFWDHEHNKTSHGAWVKVPPHGIPAPDCNGNVWSRDNHHGNVAGGQWTGYEWEVPDWMLDKAPEQCVLRMRYNISTMDMPHFDSDSEVTTATLTAANNKSPGGKNTKPAKFDIGAYYGVGTMKSMNGTNGNGNMGNGNMGNGNMGNGNNANWANGRGYEIRNNPQPDPFGIEGSPVKLQLAINTAQYGRTFQDRTHKFAVRRSPLDAGSIIHNVQVRGKRGNIVQTYPGNEYDFTPNTLNCKNGEYVHFQWTGSNTNPNNNAGQGRQGTDRSNIVLLRGKNYNEPKSTDNTNPPTFGHWGNSYPGMISGESAMSFLGLDKKDMQHLAVLDTPGGQFGGEMSELDDAGTYYDLGPRKCTQNGIYNYMCTRNNNFSNRSQKGKIIVGNTASSMVTVGVSSGSYSAGALTVETEDGSLMEVTNLQLSSTALNDLEGAANSGIEPASEVVSLIPLALNLAPGKKIKISVAFESASLRTHSLMHATAVSGPWTEVDDAEEQDGLMIASVSQGGYYVVDSSVDGGAVAGIVIAILVVIAIVAFVIYKRKGSGAHQI